MARMMMELDGRPVSAEELCALGLYNYAHFTSMRVDNAGVRGLSLHLDRLVRDCKIVHGADLDPDTVRALIKRTATESPVIVRVTVFDPGLDLARPGASAEPRVLVTTRPAPTGTLPPLKLQVAQYQRELPCVKHTGLFATVHLRRSAQLKGFDDVLFTDRDARISEGATWNIAFLCGQRVVWPASACLEGVTMRLVNAVMQREEIEFDVSTVSVGEMPQMRSAFVTNAAVGVRPVSGIDGLDLSLDAPILALLQRAYAAIPPEPL